jgi:hypothetical protein
MDDFDLKAEIERNKRPLILMSIALFVITFIIVLIASKGSAPGSRSTPLPQTASPKQGVILDYSDPSLPEDRMDMPEPIVFFTRGPGTNRLHFNRIEYALDNAEFDEPIKILEKR